MNEENLNNVTPEPVNNEAPTQEQPAAESQESPDANASGGDKPIVEMSELMKDNADLKANNAKLKTLLDKYTSEIGDLKKQMRATMTEAEQQAQAKMEAEKAKDERLAQLERNEKLRDAVERYMTLGLSKESAKTLADAELDGDMDTVTNTLMLHMNARDKATEERVRADLLAQMPVPVSGNGDGQVDYQKQAQDALASGDTQGYIMAQLMGAQETNN